MKKWVLHGTVGFIAKATKPFEFLGLHSVTHDCLCTQCRRAVIFRLFSRPMEKEIVFSFYFTRYPWDFFKQEVMLLKIYAVHCTVYSVQLCTVYCIFIDLKHCFGKLDE